MTTEEKRCWVCNKLGVTHSVLGVEVCEGCAVIAAEHADEITATVRGAVTHFLVNHRPPEVKPC